MIQDHTTQQPSLFSTRHLIARTKFEGSDIDHARDTERLKSQLLRIFELMKDGKFRSLQQISDATGAPHASASAQLRNLKKARNGGHTLNKRYLGNGLFEYQILVNQSEA
jgi:hypothetical protein